MRRPLIIGLVGVFILLPFAALRYFEPGEIPESILPQVERSVGNSSTLIAGGGETGVIEVADGLRVPTTPRALAGRIVDGAGNGVAGAEVLWTALERERGASSGWKVITSTDEAGAYSFDEGPGGMRAAVLWASHEDFMAAYLLVATERDDRAPMSELVLEPAARRQAHVHELGRVVDRAEIVQRGHPVGVAGEAYDALRVFERIYESGDDGIAEVVTLPGEETILACRGARVSAPYLGPSRGDVTLDLLPSFLADGVVFLNEPGMPPEARVSVTVPGAVRGHALGSASVGRDGEWGPVRVPLTGDETFAFDLAGGEIVPLRREVAAPEPDAEVRVDFDASFGIGVRFLVLDEEKNPLAGARAAIHWLEGERWVSTKSAPCGEDGRVLVKGCPSAPIYFDVLCSGYASYRGGPYLITSPDDAFWTVELRRASGLVVQCVHDGEPVPTFKVVYWPTGDRDQIRRGDVRDDPSGEFELDDVLPGDLSLVVASEEYAQSGVRQVALAAGERAELVVELPDAQEGVGRVVDGVTEEPIAGAEVKAYVSGTTALDDLGEPVYTDEDGRFRIGGMGPDPVFFRARADGYSIFWKEAKAPPTGQADLGVLPLWRTQPLTIRLVHDESEDPTEFSVKSGRTILPETTFPSDGVLRIEDFGEGTYDFVVRCPEWVHVRYTRQLRAGVPWDVDLDVRGGGRLIVEVVEPGSDSLPLPLWVDVETAAGDHVYRGLSDEGRAELPRVSPGPFEVEIYDTASQTLAVESGTLEEATTATVRVELRRPHRFRVVDADGNAVAAATVWFDLTDGSGDSFHTVVDSAGETSIRLPEGDVVAHVIHPTLGTRGNIPVHVGLENEVILLELEARESLPITLLDVATPAVGVTCILRVHENTIDITHPRFSDEAGRVSWGPLAEAEYDFVASHPDYWPVEEELLADSQARVVQIRKRGTLEFDVDSPSGRDENLLVEVLAVDYGLNVAEWVASGKIDASSELRTDADGRLRIPGLPHGTYHWTVLASDGPVEGDIVVPAADTASERILIP